MAGTAPAADSAGNIYLLAGNGTFDTTLNANGFPSSGDYGNSFLKISTSAGLKVADYFATFDTVAQSNADNDLGSGGVLLLPDLMDGSGMTRHLALGAGKDSNIYVVDRDNMGKFNPSANSNYQQISGGSGGRCVLEGGVFQQHGVLRSGGGCDQGILDQRCEAFGHACESDGEQLWVSGIDAEHFGQRKQQRNPVGCGEC